MERKSSVVTEILYLRDESLMFLFHDAHRQATSARYLTTILSKEHKLKLNTLTKKLVIAAVMAGSATLSISSYGSGSFSRPSNGLQDSYNQGKAVFYRKVVCSSCPLHGEKINRSSADEIAQKISSDAQYVSGLSKRERMAVVKYLGKRYKLN